MKWDGAIDALSPGGITPSPTLQFGSPSLGSDSTSGHEGQSTLRYSPSLSFVIPLPSPPHNKKRKSAGVNDKSNGNTKQPQVKKTSHNVIEKRYRSNLNDKISALRDSVPALRPARKQTLAKKEGSSDSEGSDDDTGGPISGIRTNKATILAKATEYIHELEKQNQRLQEDNSTLRNRLRQALRPQAPVIVSSTQGESTETSTTQAPRYDNTPEESAALSSSPSAPTGMLEVPESMRRLRMETSSQPHYADEILRYGTQSSALDTEDIPCAGRGRIMSRLLLGSLAGLMIMEGFNESEQVPDGRHQKRGLFALPRELITESRGFRDPIRRRILAFLGSARFHRNLPIFKVAVVFMIMVFVVFFIQSWLGKGPSKQSAAGACGHMPGPLSQGDAQTSAVVRPVLQAPSRKRRPTDSKLVTLIYVLREFFARQAIGWVGQSWLPGDGGDEEAASFPSLDAEAFRRRWLTYSQLLPKLLDERNSG